MKRNSRPLIVVLVLLVITLLSSGIAYGGGSEALKGVKSVKAVFDFRTGDPAKAVTYLTLIGDTFNNRNIQKVTKSPDHRQRLGFPDRLSGQGILPRPGLLGQGAARNAEQEKGAGYLMNRKPAPFQVAGSSFPAGSAAAGVNFYRAGSGSDRQSVYKFPTRPFVRQIFCSVSGTGRMQERRKLSSVDGKLLDISTPPLTSECCCLRMAFPLQSKLRSAAGGTFGGSVCSLVFTVETL